MIDFASLTFGFPLPAQGSPQTQEQRAAFPSAVNRADCAIESFDVRFTNDDNHLFRYMIEPTAVITDKFGVTVSVQFLLRDNSGNIDDPFNGTVRVLVIV